MFSGYYRVHMILRGYVRSDIEEIDENEINVRIWTAEEELSKGSLRKPRLEINFYDELQGSVELLFTFRINWQDREADIDEYVEHAISTIEGVASIIIDEHEIEEVVPE